MARSYRRRVSSGGLRNQILIAHTALNSNTVNQQEFTEFGHRSNDVVLRRFDLDFAITTPNINDDQVCDVSLITKPLSEGVPVTADLVNERYAVEPHRCMTGTLSGTGATDIDRIHMSRNLKIKVPMTNNVYIMVHNATGVTIAFAYLIRLFWKLL